jgi:hypothetical protein
MIHLKTEVSTLRVFKEGYSYDDREGVLFSCTVHYLADNEVYICNAVGEISRKTVAAIRKLFIGKGIRTIKYERNKDSREMKTSRESV